MIALLRGVPIRATGEDLILDVHGVGYLVRATTDVLREAASAGDAEITIHIHTVVREDAIQLFGCSSITQLAIFERLLGLQGVGPKLALVILSSLSVEQLVRAAQTEDVALLQSVPGVGPKVARRLATELKDRLKDLVIPSSTTSLTAHVTDANTTFLDAREALVGLGLSVPTAELALSETDPQATADERVRQALAVAGSGARSQS